MILCSKLVFLNVVTQLMKAEDILNANYFIVDRTLSTGSHSNGQYASIASSAPHLNSFGELVYGDDDDTDGLLDFSYSDEDSAPAYMKSSTTTSLHPYHIHYADIFSTSQYYTMATTEVQRSFENPADILIRDLNHTEKLKNVYQEICQVPLEGNGLQILIMYDDYGCQKYGGIIASHLSELFGYDVTFVDAQYRRDVNGHVYYPGNKQRAKQFIQELRDRITIEAIRSTVETAAFGSCMNNLEQLFNNKTITIEDMFRVYNLLFPNDPLPVGEYTLDHIKRIIIGRVMHAAGKTGEQKSLDELGLSNIGMGMYSFKQMLEEFGVEAGSFEEDFSNIS